MQYLNFVEFELLSLRLFFFRSIDERDESHSQRSRKRTRNPDKHRKNQKKVCVQKGLKHETKSGKTIHAKIFCEQSVCTCKNKCAEKIDVTDQKRIYETFYNLKNWSEKTLYLRSLVKNTTKKENLDPVKINSKRKYTYFVINSKNEHQRVCLQFIIKCLQITQSSMNRALRSSVENSDASDLRGKFPNNIIKSEDKHFILEFIGKFPRYSSHYSTTVSKKMYLNPNLNIIKLYREYVAVCNFENRTVLKESFFRHIFNTKFNLAFKPRKSDTCRTCDKLEARLKSLQTDYDAIQETSTIRTCHLDIVKKNKQEFDECIDEARNILNKTEVFTFDLQRALEVPSIATSEAFYSRLLWVYNLCIFDEIRKKAHMYIWNESIASRGPEEIFSCIYKYVSEIIPKDTKKIIMFSDACPGQNRNIKTTIMLKKLLNNWPYVQLRQIEQRFYVSGHSYNACDRCFSLIERQKKVSELTYVPRHWVNIITESKKTEPKFEVFEMSRQDFLSCKELQNIITNRKKSISGEKISWLKTQKIIYERSKPFELMIQYYASESLPVTHISLKKRGCKTNFSNTRFKPLYTKTRPITKKKFDDLQKLMQYIPNEYHSFYRSLCNN